MEWVKRGSIFSERLQGNETIFPSKNLVTFRSVPSHSEMELVPFQFHKNCNEFRNDSFRRFVTNKSGPHHLKRNSDCFCKECTRIPWANQSALFSRPHCVEYFELGCCVVSAYFTWIGVAQSLRPIYYICMRDCCCSPYLVTKREYSENDQKYSSFLFAGSKRSTNFASLWFRKKDDAKPNWLYQPLQCWLLLKLELGRW